MMTRDELRGWLLLILLVLFVGGCAEIGLHVLHTVNAQEPQILVWHDNNSVIAEVDAGEWQTFMETCRRFYFFDDVGNHWLMPNNVEHRYTLAAPEQWQIMKSVGYDRNANINSEPVVYFYWSPDNATWYVIPYDNFYAGRDGLPHPNADLCMVSDLEFMQWSFKVMR